MHNILNELITEQANPNTRHIDFLGTEQIVRKINEEDRNVAIAIEAITPQIAAAVDLIVDAFRNGGRLFYIGAGTSGRLGILDASECPPTFGTDPRLVQGLIAGGDKAIREAVEGAEDSEELGADDMKMHDISESDVVVGIAASGRTPYVLGAMKKARQIGAKVIGLCNNPHTPMAGCADLMLEAVVGPEAILGSTRMKAGTAQKMILNMLTTAAMIRIGKVYRNLMVDLQPSNEKLVHRSKRIIKLATGADDETVNRAFTESNGHVKTAIVMILTDTGYTEAERLLTQAQGFVGKAITAASEPASRQENPRESEAN